MTLGDLAFLEIPDLKYFIEMLQRKKMLTAEMLRNEEAQCTALQLSAISKPNHKKHTLGTTTNHWS
ncbi:hypothetical protein C0J52_12446 [Blattella germanica]|nr:hypothetical protein C0J52_12446 [Blattella germanica]